MVNQTSWNMVIPAARPERGMIPEMMEPLFKYAGHGSATRNYPQPTPMPEVDHLGRYWPKPGPDNPDYRTLWHSMIEDHCRNYDIDGIMWCNERRSPLDQLIRRSADLLL